MEIVERLIGRPEYVGPAIGYGCKAAYHWRLARAGRAPGDLPSAEVMRRLLAYSAAHGLGLTAEHLIWGAPAAEVEEILASPGTLLRPRFRSGRREHRTGAAGGAAAAASRVEAAE